ncbi:VTT domain-containing protein [Fodinibacter luteus]|uniref:TVP38/TMEM64 family protein n=1 Tax=Fodinibacter luteus TaxID=552064 RepID=UPI0031EFA9EE
MLGLALVMLFLAMFAVTAQLRIPLVSDPLPHLESATWPAALLGTLLLVSDVALPVPSSGVMIAHGAAFGLVPGALLSLVGGTGATLTAYVVGGRSRGLVDRLVTDEQQQRGARLLERHGMWAIVATRPVPMLAETVGILAGTSSTMPWWKVTVAAALGNVVPAVAYAATGALALRFVNGLTVFLAVLAVALLVGILSARAGRPRRGRTGQDQHGDIR